MIIINIERSESTIYARFKFKHSKAVEFFNRVNAFCEFPLINISNVPKSVLSIPFVGLVYPLTLVLGEEIYIELLDSDFYNSLNNFKELIHQYYPRLPCNKSKLNVSKLEKNRKMESEDNAVLFSGGVDSTAMLIRHFNERPSLITILGEDPKLYEKVKIKALLEYISRLSSTINLRHYTINFLNPINIGKIDVEKFRSLSWNPYWGGLAVGLTLPSLVAPLAYSKGLSKVYAASGFSKRFKYPWSDRSEIYNLIKFAGAKVVSDDGDLSRLEKLMIIKRFRPYLVERGINLKLRTCISGIDVWNCGSCEKCLRTIAMLVALGENPKDYGFYHHYPTSLLIKLISKLKIEPYDLIYWSEIKSALDGVLNNIDFEGLIRKTQFKKIVNVLFHKFRLNKLGRLNKSLRTH